MATNEAEAVRSFAQRIESELDEIEVRKASIKKVCREAKAAGEDDVALRSVIAEKRKKPLNADREAKMAEYRKALAAGESVRSAAAKAGIPKTTAHRMASHEKNGTAPPVPLPTD